MSKSTSEPIGVSEALGIAKRALESCTLRIIGEVSELSIKAGYKAVYFTIKDEKSSLPCMMWNNRYAESNVDLRVGMLVELSGRFSLYAAKGRMNFDVFSISMAGEGDLRLKVANLAKKLASEGLMDLARKRPIPPFCTTIGLVTSPRGDAVYDVLRTLRRRFPVARVLLAGVPVEGARAPLGIIEGMRCVCDAGAQVVLVVRGGGSYEDLMPFNDEELARAIASCPRPVITGIGHEPDTSIADMVADLRASTPTAAAESVSPSSGMLDELFARRMGQLQNAVLRPLDRAEQKLARYRARPLFTDPTEILAQPSLSCDSLAMRLASAIPDNIARDESALAFAQTRLQAMLPHLIKPFEFDAQRACANLAKEGEALLVFFTHRMSIAASRLNDLSPLAVLARGYSMVQTPEGSLVKSTAQIEVDDELIVQLSDGGFSCKVTDAPYEAGLVSLRASNDDAVDAQIADSPAEWKETLW